MPAPSRFQAYLDSRNLPFVIKEFPSSTRTSQEAADAIGCSVAQIAKSLLFRLKSSGTPVLVVVSGANRVNEKALRGILGEKPALADEDWALERTGYAVGGIPPFGHDGTPIRTLIDADLTRHGLIWTAAGTPHAVFPLTPMELVESTGGEVVSIR